MFDAKLAEIAQLVEHQFPKLKAAGSNPVFRSFISYLKPYETLLKNNNSIHRFMSYRKQ